MDHLGDVKCITRDGVVRVLGKNLKAHLANLWELDKRPQGYGL